jgi:hypothetical protein
MLPAMLLTMFDADLDHGSFLSHVDPAFAVFFFLSVGAIALFTFLSVATFSGTRQAEREAYYKAEMMKKIAEAGGGSNPALDYLREQERIAAAKRLGGYKLAGLINIGIGLGVMALLGGLVHNVPVYLCGAVPALVGLALLAHATWFAPERDQVKRPVLPAE